MRAANRPWFWIFPVLAALLVASTGFAFPTILNYVPIVDTVAKKTLFIQIGDFNFHFKNAPPAPFVSHSLVYSLTYGFGKAEVGVDLIGDHHFANTDSGLYAGPTAFNAKYRLMTEGTGRDRFSVALGIMNLGVTRYDNQWNDWYVPSPYFVFAKKVGNFRLHLGYQWSLNGYQNLDTDKARNDGLMGGADVVLIKSKTNPVTLLLDCYGGRAGCFGVGLTQPFGKGWSWAFSYYIPLRDHLQVSGGELPRQHYIGIGYNLVSK